MKHLLFLVGFLVLIGTLIACGEASNTNTGTTSASSPAATQASHQHFKVGETVTIGNTWKVVVNSVKTDKGGQFSALKAGNTYLVVDISLTNISSQEQSISSALNFTLQDATGQKYTESIDTNAGATPDGKVAAGSPLRGSIAYEVPASMKTFTLSFTPDITASGQSIWDLKL